jgi:dephospho-CoA kinase
VIGVVGGIGAGKSLVSAGLEKRGAFLIDADRVGHALLEQRPCRDLVAERFGEAVLVAGEGSEGAPTVDRKALGRLVFSDEAAKRDLERILHPRMRKTFERAIYRTIRQGRHPAVVLDAAVLFEAGWDSLCDLVVFVDAPRAQRLARLESSRNWTSADLEAREAAQWPLARKQARANLVMTNTGTPEELDEAVGRLWLKRVGATKPVPEPGHEANQVKTRPQPDAGAPSPEH